MGDQLIACLRVCVGTRDAWALWRRYWGQGGPKFYIIYVSN